MNRKIAAIFAADVAGYSKLVAEDEEETLRRLASYRAVMDDFIARAGGRRHLHLAHRLRASGQQAHGAFRRHRRGIGPFAVEAN